MEYVACTSTNYFTEEFACFYLEKFNGTDFFRKLY